MDYAKESLKLHEQWKGKIEVVETVPVKSKEDLALAYTPGVAEPCLAIQKDVNKSYDLTRRHNMCLVVTDGSAAVSYTHLVVGVGIGGTFDKAALLAKKALMRPVDSENPDPFYADLEKEMLEKVNKLGIGPQGFGGKTTAIGLNIETLPTHIAGMPCAVNINCHVTRHKTEVI